MRSRQARDARCTSETALATANQAGGEPGHDNPRYRTIVADPPWPIYESVPRWGGSTGRVKRPYQVMPVDAIADLPVASLAARRSHLYLWTLNEFIEDAYTIARRWGFEPSVLLTWCKPPRPGYMGGLFPSNTEYALYCTRDFSADIGAWLRDHRRRAGLSTNQLASHWPSRTGGITGCVRNWELGLNAPSVEQWQVLKRVIGFGDEMDADVEDANAPAGTGVRADSRWFAWPISEHSRKPDAFLDIVEQVSPGPRLEMFARRQRLGWDTWGNEALNHVEVGT